jgi:hypothetical protein
MVTESLVGETIVIIRGNCKIGSRTVYGCGDTGRDERPTCPWPDRDSPHRVVPIKSAKIRDDVALHNAGITKMTVDAATIIQVVVDIREA